MKKPDSQPHLDQPVPRVTMRLVGEKAGVSGAAVSLALRNHPSIPATTRRRILQVAKKLGYRPNPMVSALMASIHTKRTQSESPVLGLIIEQEHEAIFDKVPFYGSLFAGARKRAASLGYTLENFLLPPGGRNGRRLHRVLFNRNIRGVILAPTFRPGGKIELPLDGLACGALGHSLRRPAIHRVGTHYPKSMQLACNQLTARGYRRPGYIQVRSQLERGQMDQMGAFLAWQEIHPECGGVPPLILDEQPDAHVEISTRKLLAWFKRYRPDVMIFPPWALLEPLARHLRVPEEVGVIVSDHEPGWSEVQEPAEYIGAGAVDLVVAQIHRNETGVPISPKTVLVESSWLEGKTLPVRKVAGSRRPCPPRKVGPGKLTRKG